MILVDNYRYQMIKRTQESFLHVHSEFCAIHKTKIWSTFANITIAANLVSEHKNAIVQTKGVYNKYCAGVILQCVYNKKCTLKVLSYEKSSGSKDIVSKDSSFFFVISSVY